MNSQATVAWPPAQTATLADAETADTGLRARWEKRNGVRPSLPLLATVAVHAMALGWILFGGQDHSKQAAPLDAVVVTMMESSSQPKPEPVQVQQPELTNVPKAVVPQPELDIEQSTEATTAIRQVVATSAPQPAPAETAPVSQPRFDADYLNNPAPSYPAQSRRLREHGEVRLRVLVNREGLPVDVQVARSCGYTRLDQAALEAVRKWKFQPAQRGGVPVDAWVIVPIEFGMESHA